MSQSIFSIDNIDNTNTLFENVIKKNYPTDEWDSVLIKTKFLRNSILKTIKKFIESQGTVCLKEFSDNPEITSIVFDSFSAYTEMLLSECRIGKKGFDIWNSYNEEVGKLLNYVKSIKKDMLITGHYEIL